MTDCFGFALAKWKDSRRAKGLELSARIKVFTGTNGLGHHYATTVQRQLGLVMFGSAFISLISHSGQNMGNKS